MEDGGSAFDFEALDEDAEQISLISTAPASSADGGEEYQTDGGGFHETKYELEEEFDIAVEGQGFSALRPHYLDVLSDWVYIFVPLQCF